MQKISNQVNDSISNESERSDLIEFIMNSFDKRKIPKLCVLYSKEAGSKSTLVDLITQYFYGSIVFMPNYILTDITLYDKKKSVHSEELKQLFKFMDNAKLIIIEEISNNKKLSKYDLDCFLRLPILEKKYNDIATINNTANFMIVTNNLEILGYLSEDQYFVININ